jgi:hypothetical protein
MTDEIASRNILEGYRANLSLINTLLVIADLKDIKALIDKANQVSTLSNTFTTYKVTFTDYSYEDLKNLVTFEFPSSSNANVLSHMFHKVRIVNNNTSIESVDDPVATGLWIPRMIFGEKAHELVNKMIGWAMTKTEGHLFFKDNNQMLDFCKKVIFLNNISDIFVLFLTYDLKIENVFDNKPASSISEDDLDTYVKGTQHVKNLTTGPLVNFSKGTSGCYDRPYLALIRYNNGLWNKFVKKTPLNVWANKNIFGGSELAEDVFNFDNLSFLAGTKDNFVEYGLPPKMNILKESDKADVKFEECMKKFENGEEVSTFDVLSCIPKYMFDYLDMKVEGGTETLDKMLSKVSNKEYLFDDSTSPYVKALIQKSILATMTEAMSANADLITQIRMIAKRICKTKKREGQIINAGALTLSKINFAIDKWERITNVTNKNVIAKRYESTVFVPDALGGYDVNDDIRGLFDLNNLNASLKKPLEEFVEDMNKIDVDSSSSSENEESSSSTSNKNKLADMRLKPRTSHNDAKCTDFLRLVVLLKKVYFNAVQVEVVSKIKRWSDSLLSDVKIEKDTIVNIMRRVGVLSNEAAGLIRRQDEFIVKLVDDLHDKVYDRRLTPVEKQQLIINVGTIDQSSFNNNCLDPYYKSYQDNSSAKDGSEVGKIKPDNANAILPPNVSKFVI